MAMPTPKIFRIDVLAKTVTPALHHISLLQREEVAWVINDGNGKVVFDPTTGDPVQYTVGPDFDWQQPAVGTAKTAGFHPHTMCCWYTLPGGLKTQAVLTAVLIIDP